jgi:hypothetical protein
MNLIVDNLKTACKKHVQTFSENKLGKFIQTLGNIKCLTN